MLLADVPDRKLAHVFAAARHKHDVPLVQGGYSGAMQERLHRSGTAALAGHKLKERSAVSLADHAWSNGPLPLQDVNYAGYANAVLCLPPPYLAGSSQPTRRARARKVGGEGNSMTKETWSLTLIFFPVTGFEWQMALVMSNVRHLICQAPAFGGAAQAHGLDLCSRSRRRTQTQGR